MGWGGKWNGEGRGAGAGRTERWWLVYGLLCLLAFVEEGLWDRLVWDSDYVPGDGVDLSPQTEAIVVAFLAALVKLWSAHRRMVVRDAVMTTRMMEATRSYRKAAKDQSAEASEPAQGAFWKN